MLVLGFSLILDQVTVFKKLPCRHVFNMIIFQQVKISLYNGWYQVNIEGAFHSKQWEIACCHSNHKDWWKKEKVHLFVCIRLIFPNYSDSLKEDKIGSFFKIETSWDFFNCNCG